MRRWNGWGLDSVSVEVSRTGRHFLQEMLGQSRTGVSAPFEDILLRVPPSRIPDHPSVHKAPDHRLRHARGQSLPDWIALRFGAVDSFPDGVATPSSDEEVDEIMAWARKVEITVIPYGGGTSVVGGVTPISDGRPTLTVDLSRMTELHHLDEQSQLATFGAGVTGPHIEAPLRSRGFTLGHFPESFEFSTLGGWVATRSAGQQSLLYGKVEDLFAGGHGVTPAGPFDIPPFAGSAAGPDLRHLVLGSEGRLGILTRATVRVSKIPEVDEFHAFFFPSWPEGIAAVRDIAQDRIPLSMVRLSNPLETTSKLILSGHERMAGLMERYLHHRGMGPERCMMILGVAGGARQAARTLKRAAAIGHAHGGIWGPDRIAEEWRKKRFHVPYYRNAFWELGYAVDTLETCLSWSSLLDASGPILNSLRHGLEKEDERVLAFAHVSHVYPTGASLYVTAIFRLGSTAEATLSRWRTLKGEATRVIMDRGGTVTHHHGIGLDHAPYLGAEKGELGLQCLASAFRVFDPSGLMNPRKLLEL